MTAFFIFSMFKIFSNLFNFSLFVALIKKLSIPTAVLELGLTVISLGLIKKFSPICLISSESVAEKNKVCLIFGSSLVIFSISVNESHI